MSKKQIHTRAQYGKEAILEMIRQGKIHGNKLPSEEELTKLIGVSLATLREALSELNNEGMISKRHGSGNYVHSSTLQTKMRIDRYSDFINLLEDGGYKATSTYSSMRLEKVPSGAARTLNLESEAIVVAYERLFWADGQLAICAQNKIPYRHFVQDLKGVEGTPDLGTLIWMYCRKDLAHGIQEFVPTVAGQEEKVLLGLEPGTAMISWRETFYTVDDLPICLSWVRFHPELVRMTTLWKWGQKA